MSGSLPHVSPPGSPRARDGVELPQLLAGLGVVGADEAALLAIAIAALQPLDRPCRAIDDRPARVGEALGAIGDDGVPDHLAGARVERDQPRVGGREEHLVAVDRDVAHRAEADRAWSGPTWFSQIRSPVAASSACTMFIGVGEIHDAVVHERHRLVGAGLVHRPHPRQPQVLDVGRS